MTEQPRYRIIYSTTKRPYMMMWDQVSNRLTAVHIHAALAKLPSVTFSYIYDGETRTRFNVAGTKPQP